MVDGINGQAEGKPRPPWAKDDPRFAPYDSPLWERWRERERNPNSASVQRRFCVDCGFVHKWDNHGPARERS